MIILIKKTNKKNHVSFIPHAFSQSKHPFDQCKYFNQVEPFEKPWLIIVIYFRVSIFLFSSSLQIAKLSFISDISNK